MRVDQPLAENNPLVVDTTPPIAIGILSPTLYHFHSYFTFTFLIAFSHVIYQNRPNYLMLMCNSTNIMPSRGRQEIGEADFSRLRLLLRLSEVACRLG